MPSPGIDQVSTDRVGDRPGSRTSPPPSREVRHEYTLNWVPLLKHLGISLLVSTYQAGKLVVVRAGADRLELDFHNFDQPMGIAVRPDRLAVGTRAAVWLLGNVPELARGIGPPGAHDACFVARSAHVTGEIQVHEMGWSGDELWMVNTLFSCLCTLDGRHSFVPRWRPPIVKALAAEDRCHLNGMAMVDGRPAYVTMLGESDAPKGWRPAKATGGLLVEVASGEAAVRGLCMPHSPRVHEGRLWLLDSGKGHLVTADPDRGTCDVVAALPGYARGLAFVGPFAFVGLSKIRETSTFGGVPIAADRAALRCGVAVVELTTGRPVGLLQFHSGVDEIFDVQALPGVRSPVVSGPHAHLDGRPPIWMVPTPGRG